MSSRLLFPADRTAYVYTALGEPILIPSHAALELFTEEECVNLADIRAFDGSRILNSTIYTDDAGLIPEFYGPLGKSRLWAKPVGGPAYPIDANYGVRIDALEAAPAGVTSLRSGDGPPSDLLGSDGDFYVDEVAHSLYGPKEAGHWPDAPISLIGAPGPAGPAGDGGAGQNYTHSQYLPSEVWTIQNPLPFVPNISVFDSSGSQVFGDVQILSTTQIQIRFTASFAGLAYLS
jgi:hypothetical protein